MPDFDRAALSQLLRLQGEDSEIKRLEERRASLPEAARLQELTVGLAELAADLEIARKQSDELQREQSRIDGEVGLLDGKIERQEKRLFSGAVSNPKELSALKAEVEMLKRKKGELEDAELEVMVQRDDASATLERLSTEHDETESEVDRLRGEVDRIVAEIDEELKRRTGARTEIAGTVPADLLTLYDRIRAQKGGVGAAALEGDTCLGCHTRVPGSEARKVRAEGGLQRCDNCRRILIAL